MKLVTGLSSKLLIRATLGILALLSVLTLHPRQSLADAPLDGKAVFYADDGIHGSQLYFTDGTAVGTFPIKLSDRPRAVTGIYSLPGKVAIATEGASNAYYVNFVGPDGTAGPSRNPPQRATSQFRVFDGKLYWQSQDQTTGAFSVFESDGVTTTRFPTANGLFFVDLFSYKGDIYGTTVGCTGCGDNNVTVWKLEGGLFIKAWTYATSSSSCCYFTETELNGRLLFANWTSTRGTELWSTDGTARGAKLIKDINFGSLTGYVPASVTSGHVTIGGHMLFAANSLSKGIRLWSTDGTAEGTIPLPISFGTSDVAREVYGSLKVAGNKAYFIMRGPLFGGFQFGATLFETDGTAAGTKPVVLATRNGGVRPLNIGGDFAISGKWLYFAAVNYKSDKCPEFFGNGCDDALYRYNTENGRTELVKNIFARPIEFFSLPGDYIAGLKAVGNSVIFGAADKWTTVAPISPNAEPWASDGTADGTLKITDVARPGLLGSNPQNFVPLGPP